jgi:hypothetical protein
MRLISGTLFIALVAGAGVPSLPAQEWGDLAMTFVYGDGAPDAAPLEITSDREFCSKFHVVDESLTINPENQGVANVIVWLALGRGETAPDPHPSYEQTADDKVLLDNKDCRFAPHALVLRTSQTLIVGNSDAIGHNCKIDTFANPPINYTIPANGRFEHRFHLPERLPARVSCSIHPWMSAWLLIKDNPYMAVSDENGKLVIRNLPVGKWTLQVWQERAGYIDQVTIDGTATAWTRGRLEVEIQAGDNDLGEVKLAPALFADR